jgi:bilin biosynthesis protein
MDNRFANLFRLTEAEAITLLDIPLDRLSEDDSRYVAAAQLAHHDTPQSIQALMRAIQNTDPTLDNRIVRRKAIESLGKLHATEALPLIRTCLVEIEDTYTVENAVWAIGEIGTQDVEILENIAQLLDVPEQTYRVIIHTLTKLNYRSAVDRIRPFMESEDAPTASAAIAAVCRFTQNDIQMGRVVDFLQHPNVYARRLCIQDLIDARYYRAIPNIAQCPVSLVFRLRGIRLLGEAGIPTGAIAFAEIQPYLEQVLIDHPKDLSLVHAYDQPPTLEFLINELFETDFGRCYLATQTILDAHAETAGAALMTVFQERAYEDYGAHYNVIKLWGWLKYQPAYEHLIESLHHPQPQYQKSRAAAAIALGELGDRACIPALQSCLTAKPWDLRYATLLVLEKFGEYSDTQQVTQDSDWAVQAKAQSLQPLTV